MNASSTTHQSRSRVWPRGTRRLACGKCVNDPEALHALLLCAKGMDAEVQDFVSENIEGVVPPDRAREARWHLHVLAVNWELKELGDQVSLYGQHSLPGHPINPPRSSMMRMQPVVWPLNDHLCGAFRILPCSPRSWRHGCSPFSPGRNSWRVTHRTSSTCAAWTMRPQRELRVLPELADAAIDPDNRLALAAASGVASMRVSISVAYKAAARTRRRPSAARGDARRVERQRLEAFESAGAMELLERAPSSGAPSARERRPPPRGCPASRCNGWSSRHVQRRRGRRLTSALSSRTDCDELSPRRSGAAGVQVGRRNVVATRAGCWSACGRRRHSGLVREWAFCDEDALFVVDFEALARHLSRWQVERAAVSGEHLAARVRGGGRETPTSPRPGLGDVRTTNACVSASSW